MMLQHFDMEKDEPNYELKVKQVLSIKPDGFKVRLSPRKSERPNGPGKEQEYSDPTNLTLPIGKELTKPNTENTKPITILYGSNTGTCEALAHQLASNAPTRGFQATTVTDMNTAKGKLSKGQVVILIVASYNGHPSDNADDFVPWLAELDQGALDGVSYAVFGVGK